ncbi:hypothetical protein EVAR_32839_1 [Eumeta japonica]|uniref:Uncharacterized protein n=1 Tax=Eumeta variegata TaxID=151549 RepID=A0A4C1WE48_EUMVA|nr:hypothetical protein EVAR_32839_1 [Eumeta japonica]
MTAQLKFSQVNMETVQAEIRRRTKGTDIVHSVSKSKWRWAGHIAHRTDKCRGRKVSSGRELDDSACHGLPLGGLTTWWPILTDKFKESRPKSVVVPQNIDAVRELIMQDHHVTYRETKAPLGINMAGMHKMLHQDLAVKKICLRWIPYIMSIHQKQARLDRCKKIPSDVDRTCVRLAGAAPAHLSTSALIPQADEIRHSGAAYVLFQKAPGLQSGPLNGPQEGTEESVSQSGNGQGKSLVVPTTSGRDKFSGSKPELDVAVWDGLPISGPMICILKANQHTSNQKVGNDRRTWTLATSELSLVPAYCLYEENGSLVLMGRNGIEGEVDTRSLTHNSASCYFTDYTLGRKQTKIVNPTTLTGTANAGLALALVQRFRPDPPTIRYPTPSQEVGNALITPLGLQVSMGGRDYPLFNGSPIAVLADGSGARDLAADARIRDAIDDALRMHLH